MQIRFTLLTIFVFVLKTSYSQVELISIDSLLVKINQKTKSDEIIVINFWASWCKPCVEEMPLFKQADTVLKSKSIQFIFVSFDGPGELKKVKKIIKSKKITGTQYLLDAYDLNEFIPAVDRRWQGNIPYSIVLKNGKRKNHEFNFENINELLYFINN